MNEEDDDIVYLSLDVNAAPCAACPDKGLPCQICQWWLFSHAYRPTASLEKIYFRLEEERAQRLALQRNRCALVLLALFLMACGVAHAFGWIGG